MEPWVAVSGGLGVVCGLLALTAAGLWLQLRREVAAGPATSAALTELAGANYRPLLANLPHMSVFALDADLRFVLAEGADRLDGLGGAGAGLLGRLADDVIDPAVWELTRPHCLAALAGDISEFDAPGSKVGEVINVRILPLPGVDETVTGVLAITERVTAQHQAVEALHAAQEFNEAVLAASPDLMVVIDLVTGDWVWTSESVWAALGWTDATLATDPAQVMRQVLDEDVARIDEARAALTHMPAGGSLTIRFRVRGPDGDVRWLSCRATPFIRGEADTGARALAAVRDVTELVEAEATLQHAALHDVLTGLPNRARVLELIEAAIERHSEDAPDSTVLYCDLDGFKHINDTFGHEAGDAVLVEVSRRLQGVLRHQDFVGRVGGDEFVVMLEPFARPSEPGSLGDAESSAAAFVVADRITQEVARPIIRAGKALRVTMSVGIVRVSGRSTAAGALRDADSAMYRAKERGKGRVEVFDETLRAAREARLLIEAALSHALSAPPVGGARLSVAYQPIFEVEEMRLVAFEALARMTDRDGVIIPADQFIPIAERIGLIHLLDQQVLDIALGGLRRWVQDHPDESPIRMAVNLSASQAHDVDLCALICGALERHQLHPSSLVIEVTESVLLGLDGSMLSQLHELHDLGVRIAIDDFGTGYASLGYLTTLPVDILKIDRSFTRGLGTEHRKTAIIQAVAALADKLELLCVVEGIETEEQLAALPAGALGQGYLLGRPDAVPQDGDLAPSARRPGVPTTG